MADIFGSITAPALTASGTFPSIPGGPGPIIIPFGLTTILNPTVITHRLGAVDLKREQRFYIGPNPRTWQIDLPEMDHTEYSALFNFWETQSGSTTPFTFYLPLEDQTTTTVTVLFANQPFLVSYIAGQVYHVQITLVEVNLTSGPTYTVTDTNTRAGSILVPGTGIDSTLATLLTSQAITCIPLLHIQPLAYLPSQTPNLSTLDNVYVSDRRCTIGSQAYMPRLTKWSGIGQVAIGLPGVSAEADDVQFTLGNADRAIRQWADSIMLDRANVFFSVFILTSPAASTGILLNLWAGIITPGGWQSNQGPEFTIQCSDRLSSPFLVAPPHVLDHLCNKQFADSVECPFATKSTGVDNTHFGTGIGLPAVDSTQCDHGYDSPNGCLALGMAPYYNGVIATPQTVTVKDNTTGLFGFGRQSLVSASLVNDSAYGYPLPLIFNDDIVPIAVTASIIDGRDEGDFYEAIGVVGEGPLSFDNTIPATLDGFTNFGYPGPLGYRQITGQDPAGLNNDMISLDNTGDTTLASTNPYPSWRYIWIDDPTDPTNHAKGNTFLNNYSAGVAFLVLRYSKPSGLTLTPITQHQMTAYVGEGLGGWVWTAPGTSAFFISGLVNPVWVAVNVLLKCFKLYAPIVFSGSSPVIAQQEAMLDIPSLIVAAGICDLCTKKVVETTITLDEEACSPGFVPQWKFIGTLSDQRQLRDWLNDILVGCLGYFYWNYGKLSVGIRYNATPLSAYTDGNTLFRSLSPSAMGPKFTKLIATFADREGAWAANTASYQDDDYATELGGGLRPNHTISNINLPGTADIDQATRWVITRGREEMGGINQTERTAARKVTIKTTVLGFDTAPGMVISVADIDIPTGSGNFRVERWRLNPDWTIDITARSVTASMYALDTGPKIAGVKASPIPPVARPEPSQQRLCPFYETALSGDPYYGVNDQTFRVGQPTQPPDGNGNPVAIVSCVTYLPINDFYQAILRRPLGPTGTTRNLTAGITAPGAAAPIISGISTSPTGGLLAGDTTYFFAVCAYTTTSDTTKQFSPHSNIISIYVPAGTFTNSITLTGISWPAVGSTAWAGYAIFGCKNDIRMMCGQGDINTGSLPSSITFGTAIGISISTYNMPSSVNNTVRAKVKQCVHDGVAGGGVTAVATNQITVSDFAGFGDNWAGRVVSIIGRLGDYIPGVLDFTCTSWNDTTGTFTVTPDPVSSGVLAGDAITIGFAPNIISATTIGDSLLVNGMGPGLTVNGEINLQIYLDNADGNPLQIRNVVSNTATTYTIDQPWDVLPTSSSRFYVAVQGWQYPTDTPPYSNKTKLTAAVINISIPNPIAQTLLVILVIVDSSGLESLENESPIRVLYQFGVPLNEVVVTANYQVLPTDQFVFVDATSGNLVITLPDLGSIRSGEIKVIKADVTTNTVTIQPLMGQVLAGGPVVIASQFGYYRFARTVN